jgi:hypothetical protein
MDEDHGHAGARPYVVDEKGLRHPRMSAACPEYADFSWPSAYENFHAGHDRCIRLDRKGEHSNTK